MSSELRDLYQEVVIDHSRHPRNFRKLEDPTSKAEGFNPLDRKSTRLNSSHG